MRAMNTALTNRLMLMLTEKPFVSESQPTSGWVHDEVTLYAVTAARPQGRNTRLLLSEGEEWREARACKYP